MNIDILDAARDEISTGFQFYEQQAAGLGKYFLDSIYSDIESLTLSAGVHVVQFECHRMLSRRFPFAVYYRIHDDRIQILAVLDCRRSPFATARRLTEREG
jgi:hypothetical protein